MPYFSFNAEAHWLVYVVETFYAVFCCPDPDELVVADFAGREREVSWVLGFGIWGGG